MRFPSGYLGCGRNDHPSWRRRGLAPIDAMTPPCPHMTEAGSLKRAYEAARGPTPGEPLQAVTVILVSSRRPGGSSPSANMSPR